MIYSWTQSINYRIDATTILLEAYNYMLFLKLSHTDNNIWVLAVARPMISVGTSFRQPIN